MNALDLHIKVDTRKSSQVSAAAGESGVA